MAIILSTATYAADPYRIPFVEYDGITKVPFIDKEWIISADRDDWSLYIEKGMYDEHKSMYEFHAVTAYKQPYYSDGLKAFVDKIYTYGVLSCKEGNLHILFEWYVDPNETLIHRSSFEFGAYAVDMTTPDTARNEVYNQICGESV